MPIDAISNNLAAILVFLLYIAVKEIVVPRMKSRNGKNPGNHRDIELRQRFERFEGKMEQWCKSQENINERFESNIRRIFDRLDTRK